MKIRLATMAAFAAVTATGTVLTAGLATPATSAPERTMPERTMPERSTVEIRPADLSRGAAPQVPFQDRTRILDGAVTVDVDVKSMWLVGKTGDEYVIVTWGTGNRYQLRRVDSDGNLTLLRRGGPTLAGAVLSDDGSRFATVRTGRDTSVVRMYDAADGARLASRQLPGSATVLDLDADRVVIGVWGPNRTLSWNPTTDRARILVKRVAYRASIEADRLAWYTRDPYRGGCSVVGRLSDPAITSWRSCDLRVEEFSPDGARVAAVALLSDGIGPDVVQVRRVGGALLDTYRTQWFGRIAFEDADTLLLHAFGSSKAAIVRCTNGGCERASRLRAAVA